MEVELAVVVGVLYAAGFYMIMRRSIVRLILGLALLGHAANLLIFVMGRLVRGSPPVMELQEVRLSGPFADPIPEALILTAIVIGFGIQAFAIVLIKRTHRLVGMDNLD
ncbi:MAG: Na+/H+ antiporter subunit C [Syntrophobacteraceae bacterium]|jgi:multicomponent Na+:H+ antiporter subunit C|nr:Na+/H+ antiporter subunit C [Syntrophobacteraceae bacterium]